MADQNDPIIVDEASALDTSKIERVPIIPFKIAYATIETTFDAIGARWRSFASQTDITFDDLAARARPEPPPIDPIADSIPIDILLAESQRRIEEEILRAFMIPPRYFGHVKRTPTPRDEIRFPRVREIIDHVPRVRNAPQLPSPAEDDR